MRGEFFLARETAKALLQETEAGGRDAEAAEARRMLGLVTMAQGDLTAAKPMLEQALRDYNPERDGEARFRFGRDTGVSATASPLSIEAKASSRLPVLASTSARRP